MNKAIWAIPGFLGLPSDWDFLNSHGVTGVDWQAFAWNSLPDWAVQFNQWVSRSGQNRSLLIGYSFGGRLALHALLNQPELWEGAIIISAHPGLTDRLEKQKRINQDRLWAERFAQEEWKSLMEAWNRQVVFSHEAHILERQEEDYQRANLIRALLQGSLGTQQDLRLPISQLQIPILWLTGSKDPGYSSLAQGMSFLHPLSRWMKVEGAGHRLLWSQPVKCSQLILDFSNNIYANGAF